MSSLTTPSSPERRVTIAGRTMRFGSVIVRMGERREEQAHWRSPRHERAADDELLDLGRPLVDAQRAHAAVEALDGAAAHDAEAAVELHGAVDDALRGLGGEHLRHRDLGLARALRVLRPRRARDEQARGLELRRHLGERRPARAGARRAACRTARASSRARAPRRAPAAPMPTAAAPTDVRKTSSVPSARRSPCPTSPTSCACAPRMTSRPSGWSSIVSMGSSVEPRARRPRRGRR